MDHFHPYGHSRWQSYSPHTVVTSPITGEERMIQDFTDEEIDAGIQKLSDRAKEYTLIIKDCPILVQNQLQACIRQLDNNAWVLRDLKRKRDVAATRMHNVRIKWSE